MNSKQLITYINVNTYDVYKFIPFDKINEYSTLNYVKPQDFNIIGCAFISVFTQLFICEIKNSLNEQKYFTIDFLNGYSYEHNKNWNDKIINFDVKNIKLMNVEELLNEINEICCDEYLD